MKNTNNTAGKVNFDKLIAIISKHGILSVRELEKKYTPKHKNQSLSVGGLYNAGFTGAVNRSGAEGGNAYNNDITADQELFKWIGDNINALVFDVI